MEVRAPRDAAELEQALDLRERVFCGEQGVDPVTATPSTSSRSRTRASWAPAES
jgi:hypothetical protein